MTRMLALVAVVFSACSVCAQKPPAPAKPKPPGITRDVSIRFAKAKYRFTLAQAAKGISIPYEIVVKQDVPGVVPGRIGNVALHGPSGLIAVEILSGNGQHYGVLIGGAAPPLPSKPRVIKKGVYRSKFQWDGRNWSGPSDTGFPKGKPFPPGKYTLEVRCIGVVAKGKKRTGFRIVGKVPVLLVE